MSAHDPKRDTGFLGLVCSLSRILTLRPPSPRLWCGKRHSASPIDKFKVSPKKPRRLAQPLGEAFMMQKSTKCIALLASLLLLSAGLNYIFVGIAGGRANKQTQQVQSGRSPPSKPSRSSVRLSRSIAD